MAEDHGHREHVHPVMLNAVFEVAITKVQARLECGKSAAILYVLNEGLFLLGDVSKENHDLLARRYGRKLIDVLTERKMMRENSHVPVLTLEQQKEKQLLEQKDRQFKGMLDQWAEHRSGDWRRRAAVEARKYVDKLASAKALLDEAQKDGTT